MDYAQLRVTREQGVVQEGVESGHRFLDRQAVAIEAVRKTKAAAWPTIIRIAVGEDVQPQGQ